MIALRAARSGSRANHGTPLTRSFTMPEFAIHFGEDYGEAPSYKLLELPKELLELVKNGSHQQLSLEQHSLLTAMGLTMLSLG